jgi:hypothetical protein
MKLKETKRISLWIALAMTAGTLASQAQVYDPSNGHYYQVISDRNVTWMDAEVAALSHYYNNGSQNLEGHLATITSAGEDSYVGTAVTTYGGSGEFWLGGYQNPNTETVPTAGWTWVNGEGAFPGVNGAAGFDNAYSNWNPNEPNDAFGPGSEQYLGINLGNVGGFNDEGDLNQIGGYVIEFDPNTDPTGGFATPDVASTAVLLSGALALMGVVSRRMRK